MSSDTVSGFTAGPWQIGWEGYNISHIFLCQIDSTARMARNRGASMLTLTREQLVELVGEDTIMASTAIMPPGHWRVRADGRWEFISEEQT